MVGVIPGDIRMHAKPVGRGYVILEANADHPWRSTDMSAATRETPHPAAGSTTLHAHEFHYSSLSDLPADTRYAYAVRRGHGVDGQRDGIVSHRLLASYTHLRATSGCDWPAKFVQHVRDCIATDHKEPVPCSY